MADVSDWLYRMHFPLMVWIQTALGELKRPALLKLGMVAVGSTIFLLAASEAVRLTLGLSGRQSCRRPWSRDVSSGRPSTEVTHQPARPGLPYPSANPAR
jgi:hypothetical protein